MKLLLLLGLSVLLSYGVVEAKDILPDYIVEDYSNLVVVCNEDNTKCETPCEKKMKEAMKIAEKYLYSSSGTFNAEYCGAVCEAERELERAKQEQADLRKWDAVMQECVRP